MATTITLQIERVYSWAELAKIFGFAESYLGAAGGMISRPEHQALLIMTHPGGAKSFDYDDYWENARTLIYTGRGKKGDQKYVGQNRDLGENAVTVFAFELAGTKRLAYLGSPTCVKHWTERANDIENNPRDVIRYQLAFEQDVKPGIATPRESLSAMPKPAAPPASSSSVGDGQLKQPRRFDEHRLPTTPALPRLVASPEDIAQLQEKALANHHAILVGLKQYLINCGYADEDIVEIPASVDMMAAKNGQRIIFEAKTITSENVASQTRAAVAQLLEYRFFLREPASRLCIVSNRDLPRSRIAFLESLGIAVAWWTGTGLEFGGTLASALLA